MRRPVLRYHGGKWRLAPWIIGFFPPHRVYVEPFGGAASVLLRKPRSYAEVYNDLDGEVVNVFRVLRDPESAQRLEEALRLTPFARVEFEAAYQPGRRSCRAGASLDHQGVYDRELYADWQRHEREHLADGARKRTEVVWLNPACVRALDDAAEQRDLKLGASA